ncbi:MAG: glycosyltransferase, partial [Gammaproteobacteria bacterium]|nr:glycosyltransferase [Gammaproteobacteria bacterium]
MKEQKKQEVAVEKISFILPVLNEKRLVGPQLERLQVYRSAGHEVLLIDGGSSDGSPSGLAGLVDYVDIAPPGRSSQMNRGAELASGDILLFLHIDTILPESADTLIRDACKQAEWGWFDVELADDGWPYRLISWMMNRRSRITAVCTGDQALFVKRGLFLDVGGFPALPLMEDVAISKLLRGRS